MKFKANRCSGLASRSDSSIDSAIDTASSFKSIDAALEDMN